MDDREHFIEKEFLNNKDEFRTQESTLVIDKPKNNDTKAVQFLNDDGDNVFN